MVRKCANPSCSATFLRLHDGKLFIVETAAGHPQRLNYFWLCDSCSRTMTIAKQENQGTVVPLKRARTAS